MGDVGGEEKELAGLGDLMGGLCDGLNAGLG